MTFDTQGPHWVIPYGFKLTNSDNLEDLMNNIDAVDISSHDYSQQYYDDEDYYGNSTGNMFQQLVQQETLGMF